jgi:hypothetical protein
MVVRRSRQGANRDAQPGKMVDVLCKLHVDRKTRCVGFGSKLMGCSRQGTSRDVEPGEALH